MQRRSFRINESSFLKHYAQNFSIKKERLIHYDQSLFLKGENIIFSLSYPCDKLEFIIE